MNKKVVVGILLLMVVLSACSIGKETYDHGDFNFEYPKEWEIARVTPQEDEKVPEFTTLVYMLNEQGETEVTANVVTVEFTDEVNLEAFIQENIKEAASMDGYTLIKQSNITIDGKKTTLLAFSAMHNGQEKEFLQTYVAQGSRGYVLTGLFPKESESKYKVLVTNLFKSFKITPKE